MNTRANRWTSLTLPVACCLMTAAGMNFLTGGRVSFGQDENAAKNAAPKDSDAAAQKTPAQTNQAPTNQTARDRDNRRDENRRDDNRKDSRRDENRRAWIGIQLEDRDSHDTSREQGKGDDAQAKQKQRGVGVSGIYPNGPAARSGLYTGDRIVSVNGKKTDDAEDVIEAVGQLQPGAQAQFVVAREGGDQTLVVTVGDGWALRQHHSRYGGQRSYSYGGDQQGFNQNYGHNQNQGRFYQVGPGYQPGGFTQGQDDDIPEHAMMLEYQRRNAEQHERMENMIEELMQEVKNLRKEVQQLKAK